MKQDVRISELSSIRKLHLLRLERYRILVGARHLDDRAILFISSCDRKGVLLSGSQSTGRLDLKIIDD
jgi:hypothetical protein